MYLAETILTFNCGFEPNFGVYSSASNEKHTTFTDDDTDDDADDDGDDDDDDDDELYVNLDL